jgi:branched-chain amino acid transport system ATP-binding protein
MLLRTEGLSTSYGRIRALSDISLDVPQGSIVALIGANGAGKTTLLRTLSGLQPVRGGSILFEGRDITGFSAARRVADGIVQVPEGRQIFEPLTVESNLVLGAYCRPRARLRDKLDEVFAMFPVLAERRSGPAGALSGGEQQMLAIGRALMAEPKFLLLDEPSLGLAPLMTDFIFERIRDLRTKGVTILLVEQNAALALEAADTAYVLETGHIRDHGTSAFLLSSAAVQSAYLGI